MNFLKILKYHKKLIVIDIYGISVQRFYKVDKMIKMPLSLSSSSLRRGPGLQV